MDYIECISNELRRLRRMIDDVWPSHADWGEYRVILHKGYKRFDAYITMKGGVEQEHDPDTRITTTTKYHSIAGKWDIPDMIFITYQINSEDAEREDENKITKTGMIDIDINIYCSMTIYADVVKLVTNFDEKAEIIEGED